MPGARRRDGRLTAVTRIAELVRVAERPAIADVLARASRRSGGASSEAIVEAVRAGRDR